MDEVLREWKCPGGKFQGLQVVRLVVEKSWKLCPSRVVSLNSSQQSPERLFMQNKAFTPDTAQKWTLTHIALNDP